MLPLIDIEGALSEIEIAIQGSDLERATGRLLDLKDNVPLPRDLSNSVILLNSQYTELRKDRRNNTISNEDYQRAAASLSSRILDFSEDVRRFVQRTPVRQDSGQWHETDNRIGAQRNAQPPADGIGTLKELLSPSVAEGLQPGVVRPVVILANVSLQYRGFRLFIENLEVDEGIMLGVVGANSSGKTSLLRILAGDLRQSAGRIEYPRLGDIPRNWYVVKRQIGYVEQLPERWPGLAIDMLRFEAAAWGHLGTANETWVYRWVDRLRLGEHVNKTWEQLSGGFKTRFELARV